MAPILFPCPACHHPLRYELHQAGDPYECPECGGRGVLPDPAAESLPATAELKPLPAAPRVAVEQPDLSPVPLQPQQLRPLPGTEPIDERLLHPDERPQEKRKRARRWQTVHRGLWLILGAWMVVCVLSVLLLLMLFYSSLLYISEGRNETRGASTILAVLGFLVVAAETVALWGYILCLFVPVREALREWVWVALLTSAARNVGCLTTSILFLTSGLYSHASELTTAISVGLFFGQWFFCCLMLRALATNLREYWLLQGILNDMLLSLFTVAGWAFLFYLRRSSAGGFHDVYGDLPNIAVRYVAGIGGLAFCALLGWSMFYHLRVLYYVCLAVWDERAAPRGED